MWVITLQEGCEIDSIRQPLVDAVKECLPSIPSSSVSDVAWALATLDIQDQELLQCLEARAVQDVASHSCTSMCTMVWAFGKLKWHCENYLSAGNHRLVSFLKLPTSMKSRDVAILLWSFVQMEHKASHKVLLSSHSHTCARRFLPGIQRLVRAHERLVEAQLMPSDAADACQASESSPGATTTAELSQLVAHLCGIQQVAISTRAACGSA